jgi:hypothetical protein
MFSKNMTSNIKNREDFIIFLEKLLEDFRKEKNWENNNLESFIEGMLSWVEDADGYYKNINQMEVLSNPSWRLFADILIASTMYE